MDNFVYHIPTKIFFGKGQIKNLPAALSSYGKKVLLVYGGGSIKKLGLYYTVMDLLNGEGFSVTELAGVEPNPRIESVREGARLCRENDIECVLAVGGGSSIDCAKVIAAAAKYDGDAWELVTDSSKIKVALPIFSVLTLSATGSEMDPFAVISDMSLNEKIGVGSELFKPVASILDPEYTYTVSKKQTAAGTADIISHTLESYFHNVKGAYLQDRLNESLLKTCFKYGKIAIDDPENYEARANLMWASSLAINGLTIAGARVPWTVHPMEHELSAFYDITHGEGLAILTPHWMRCVLSDATVNKFYEYGVNVWGIDANLDKFEVANKAIDMTADYFKELGIPMTLREVGIGDEKLEIMAKKSAKMGIGRGFVPIDEAAALKIFKAAL